MVKRSRAVKPPSQPSAESLQPSADTSQTDQSQWTKQGGIDSELARIQQQASASKLPLESIKDRYQSDTRPLNRDHVLALAESIRVLGLIEPLAIDSQNRLLAGSHRRAAIAMVKQDHPEEFDRHFSDGLVPVLTMPFDSEAEPSLALAIETAENFQRKDYTESEVRALAERLKDAGYVSKRGKPKPGDKLLIPTLAAAIGKHRKTVERYLYGTDMPITTDVAISQRDERNKLLLQCLRSLEKWQKLEPSDNDEKQALQAIQELSSILSKLVK